MRSEADEKLHDSSTHGSDTDAPSRSDLDDDPVYSYKEQRAIIHRIDRRLVITLGLMYCMSQIDRANIGNASIAGSVSLARPKPPSVSWLTYAMPIPV